MTHQPQPLVGVRRTLAGLAVLACLSSSAPSVAQEPAAGEATPNARARRWFEDDRLGLSFHWGVYSLLGKGESVMESDKIPIAEYRKLAAQFNPAKFDAEEWAKIAKAAGARYITITTKHHDGFCMFDSKLTDYDIVDATPFARDPVKALADACRKHRIKLFLSYSLLDWHHPDFYPPGTTGKASGREAKGDWSKYVAYYQGQVRELCTNYGEIGGIRFEGWWDAPDAEWDLDGAYRMIHELQPGALVGNDHRAAPKPGEDFQTIEVDIPVFHKVEDASGLPLESCMTLNESRGYNSVDDRFKSPEEVIQALVGAAGRGSNLLLNVGPKPDGTLGAETTERLAAVGRWLEANGTSIYGTRKGPIPPQPWGVTTAREPVDGEAPVIYLHVLEPDAAPLILPEGLATSVAIPLGKTAPLATAPADGGIELKIPEDVRTPTDTIIGVSHPIPIRR